MARLYGHRDARWSPKARSNGSKCSATWMFCRANVQVKWVHLKLVFQLQLAVGRWRCHASHPAMDVLTFLLLLETDMDWWTDDFYLVIMGDHFWPRRHSSCRCGDFHGTLAARAARLEVIRWFPFNGFDVTHRWSYEDLPEPSDVHLGSPFAADAAGCVPWARRAVANCPGEFELWWGLSAISWKFFGFGARIAFSSFILYFIILYSFYTSGRILFTGWSRPASDHTHEARFEAKIIAKMLNVGLQFLRIYTENFERVWHLVAFCGILWHLVASCGILWLLFKVPEVDDVEALSSVHWMWHDSVATWLQTSSKWDSGRTYSLE